MIAPIVLGMLLLVGCQQRAVLAPEQGNAHNKLEEAAQGEPEYKLMWVDTLQGLQLGTKTSAVALSADGHTLAVAEPFHGTTGRVRVYQQQEGRWVFQTGLIGSGGKPSVQPGSDGRSVWQGGSLAMSADGQVVAFSGPWHDNFRGGIWVFERSTGRDTWEEKALLTSPDSALVVGIDEIQLSADGTVLLATTGNNGAQALVFENTAGFWGLVERLTFPGLVAYPAAVSSTGQFIAVGYDVMNGCATVEVYQRGKSGWHLYGTPLRPYDASWLSGFGHRGAFSESGNRLVLTGNVMPPNAEGLSQTAVWLFEQYDGDYWQVGSRLSGHIAKGESAESVLMSLDGRRVLLGSRIGEKGSITPLDAQNGIWMAGPLLGSKSGLDDRFGSCMSLSADGEWLVVMTGWDAGKNALLTYKRN